MGCWRLPEDAPLHSPKSAWKFIEDPIHRILVFYEALLHLNFNLELAKDPTHHQKLEGEERQFQALLTIVMFGKWRILVCKLQIAPAFVLRTV